MVARGPASSGVTDQAARKLLAAFMDRYTPEIAARARAVLAKMRKLLPGAVEMVYDNYNGLVIGFGPTEKVSDAIFSVVLYPRWVTLFFLQGAQLPDPHGLLKGEGKVVRHFVLDDASDLDRPRVRELFGEALFRARTPMPSGAKGRIVIKSVSPKQRARRPPATRPASRGKPAASRSR